MPNYALLQALRCEYKNPNSSIPKTLSKPVFQTNITRTRQTVYIEVVAEGITVVEVSKETSVETALEEVVSRVVDLIIDIIYYYYSLNKRSAIYMGNLDTG